MHKLSPRTQAVYHFIAAHIRKHGFAPTMRQTGNALGISSTSTVSFHVTLLVRAGKLTKQRYGARAIALPKAAKPATLDEPVSMEEQAAIWLALGAVVVGYQRADGTLAGLEAWQNQDGRYIRMGASR